MLYHLQKVRRKILKNYVLDLAGALLALEFPNLLKSLFKKAEKHEEIIAALASKNMGLTRNELMKTTGLPSGGRLTIMLDELEESGFISSYRPFKAKVKNTIYRLSDLYSLFFFKFIKNNTNYDLGTWLSAIDNPSQRAWAGYAFEQVCMTHTLEIKKSLGISGIQSQSFSWKSTEPKQGAQIDLLIDRRDHVINLCEIKYSISPYIISKSYAANLRNKMAVFKYETKTRKSIFLTMITTHGLMENQHSTSLIQNQITMDELFDN